MLVLSPPLWHSALYTGDGGVKKTARGGQPVGLPNSRGPIIVTAREWTVAPLLLLTLAPACSTQSLSQDGEVWRVLTTADVGNVTQRGGYSATARNALHTSKGGGGGRGACGWKASERGTDHRLHEWFVREVSGVAQRGGGAVKGRASNPTSASHIQYAPCGHLWSQGEGDSAKWDTTAVWHINQPNRKRHRRFTAFVA